MPKTATAAEQTPEIHSIANLSPVSPSPVHTSTVSALPALQDQADYFASDPADQAKAIAMAHITAPNAVPNTHPNPDVNANVNFAITEEDVGMDDDLYGEAEQDESTQNATKSQNQPSTEEDDAYAKTFDSPTSEEMGGLDEQGSEEQRDGLVGTTDTGTAEQLNVSSVQAGTGASGPIQQPPAPAASTTAATADITEPHASSALTVPSLQSADLPHPHPSLPARPETEDTPVDAEPSKGAHEPLPNGFSQQMPDSAPPPLSDASNASRSYPPVPVTGQPTVGQVTNNAESPSLPQAPSNSVSNGGILPPASADLPSRPPVDMNRMRDQAKAARHGAPKSQSKGSSAQAPGVGSSFPSAPGLPRAPGVTESLSTLGPPPGPSNPSLPAPPAMPASSTTNAPPLHYPGRQTGGEGRRGEYQSKWDAYQADEKRYTVEQKWDRFPEGSRVFIGMSSFSLSVGTTILLHGKSNFVIVGNLSSDKVTKRDVFDLFHPFGRLAQISLKSAFGFVQYHTYEEAQGAVASLQGADVKGRKIRKLLPAIRFEFRLCLLGSLGSNHSDRSRVLTHPEEEGGQGRACEISRPGRAW